MSRAGETIDEPVPTQAAAPPGLTTSEPTKSVDSGPCAFSVAAKLPSRLPSLSLSTRTCVKPKSTPQV